MPKYLGKVEYYADVVDQVDRWLYTMMVLQHEQYFRAVTKFCILYGQVKEDGAFVVHSLLPKKMGEPVRGTWELTETPEKVRSESSLARPSSLFLH